MTDIGIEALRVVHEAMLIDEEWTDWSERRFTWWGSPLAQHVQVDDVESSGPVEFAKVRIWTELVTDVRRPDLAPEVCGIANAQQSMSALVWDPEDADVVECCTAIVTAENIGWLGRVVSTVAVLQNAAAYSRAHAVAEELGGRPAESAHPRTGRRTAKDDILNVPEQLVVPAGKGPSKFDDAMLGRLEEFASGLGLLGFGGRGGFSCEVPFSGTRTAMEAMMSGAEPETALVEVSTEHPHSVFGSGAFVKMRLPIAVDDPAEVANDLNLFELWRPIGTCLLGAWSPDPTADDGVAFAAFLPNAIARPGILENMLIYMVVRSRTAAALFT